MAHSERPLLDTALVRDDAGRLLAPAYVDGHGPLSFLVDTGASHCAVSRALATRLSLPFADSGEISISGTAGRSISRAVLAASFEVGSLRMERLQMPVVEPTLAESGVVGANALLDKQLSVDFTERRLGLTFATGSSTRQAATSAPLQQRDGGLLLVTGTVDAIGCQFIVDTGAQATIGNLALARRLGVDATPEPDPVIVRAPGTGIVTARPRSAASIGIGTGVTTNLAIACADLPVFSNLQLAGEPAALLGMDFFALLSRFVIDYRRSRLSIYR